MLKEDVQCIAAKFVYGMTVQLAGEFFVSSDDNNVDP